MVGRTRAQAAKMAAKAQEDRSMPPDDIQIQLQEVVAYFEAQAENGGPIVITKDIYNKVDKIVEHCERTGDHVESSSVEGLLFYIETKVGLRDLVPKALICLLNLLVASGPGEHRIRVLDILLGDFQHKNSALACETSTTDGSSFDSKLHMLEDSMGKSLRERFNWDSECDLQTVTTLLSQLLKTTTVLTTDSPLDASKVTHRSDYSPSTNFYGKRERDEIPDSLEDQSVFEIPIDDDLEEIANSQSSHKPGLAKVDVYDLKSKSQSELNIQTNQTKQRKRAKRVTDDGSPLPRAKCLSRTNLKLERMEFPDIKNRSAASDMSGKQNSRSIALRSQQVVERTEVSKGNKPSQRSLRDHDLSTNKHTKRSDGNDLQDDRHEIEGSLVHDTEPHISTPINQVSLQDSIAVEADQLVFDQYLDFEGGVTILSQLPENIFSSPERPIVQQKGITNHVSVAVPDAYQAVLSHVKGSSPRPEKHEAETVTETKLQNPPEDVAPTTDFTKHKDASPATFSRKENDDIPISTITTVKYHSSPATYSTAENIDAPVVTHTLKEPELAYPNISQTITTNSDKDEQVSASSTRCDTTLESVSTLQIQQLVASEVEKAIRGIGSYLCGANYQDLASVRDHLPGLVETPSRNPKHVGRQNNISRVPRPQVHANTKSQYKRKKPKVLRPNSGLHSRSLDMSADMDPDRTLLNDTIEIDSDIDSPTDTQTTSIFSSTIDPSHSPPASTLAPSDISQRISEQVQHLKPKIIPVFLQTTALLMNTFHSLNDTEDILKQAVENFNTSAGGRAIDQVNMVLDQEYQRELQTLSLQLGTTMSELEKLQTLCEHSDDLLPQHSVDHSKSVSSIELAIKDLEKQIIR